MENLRTFKKVLDSSVRAPQAGNIALDFEIGLKIEAPAGGNV